MQKKYQFKTEAQAQPYFYLKIYKSVAENIYPYGILKMLTLLALCGCGVKGDPVPPSTFKDLGRGQPTYKGATQDLAVPRVPPVYTPVENKKDNEEKKEEKK